MQFVHPICRQVNCDKFEITNPWSAYSCINQDYASILNSTTYLILILEKIEMHLPANEDGIRNVAEQCSNSVTTEMNSSIYFKIVYYNEERK